MIAEKNFDLDIGVETKADIDLELIDLVKANKSCKFGNRSPSDEILIASGEDNKGLLGKYLIRKTGHN